VHQGSEDEQRPKSSYGQILKSSAMIGGSSVINIGIGIVRTKAMAVFLGPAGFGLFGIYGSIVNLSQTIGGMGVNSSGVRQIAEAVGSGDADRIAVTAAALRTTSVFLGLLGAGLLGLFSRQVSIMTFGSDAHGGAVRLLAIAVFLQLVSAGQGALIQGMRRIADLAKMGMFGALFGAAIGVPIVYYLRETGVALSLVGVAAITLLASWWYSRKVQIQVPSLTPTQTWREASALLKLGFAFMSSSLMTMGVAYVVRIIVLRKVGLEGTGFYQSAWTLGGLYVGFILQAMGADFYPRLTAGIHDEDLCNRLVNEQTQVGLLLAGPGVIATLTFAPMVIALLYSAKFGAAVPILRWICLGATMQVVTWPMGFIVVAQARQGIFFGCELAWTVVSLALAWSCVVSFGLNGAGIAFFLAYVFHLCLIYPVVRKLSGFRWSESTRRTVLLLLSLIGVVFGGYYVLSPLWAACLGTLGVVLSCSYSLRTLTRLVPRQEIPRPIRRVLVGLGVLSPEPAFVA
jgi:PST family polysaccharide transporter